MPGGETDAEMWTAGREWKVKADSRQGEQEEIWKSRDCCYSLSTESYMQGGKKDWHLKMPGHVTYTISAQASGLQMQLSPV